MAAALVSDEVTSASGNACDSVTEKRRDTLPLRVISERPRLVD